MGHRAHYSFKLKNQYINNAYQHWGANDKLAKAIAIALFSENFKNMDQVVAFIEDKKLLDIAYLYETIKKYKGQSFWCAAGKKDFITSVKAQKNVFDNQLKAIDYQEEGEKKIPIFFDIEAAYLYDLDTKTLTNTRSKKILINSSELLMTEKSIAKNETYDLNCKCKACYIEITKDDEDKMGIVVNGDHKFNDDNFEI